MSDKTDVKTSTIRNKNENTSAVQWAKNTLCRIRKVGCYNKTFKDNANRTWNGFDHEFGVICDRNILSRVIERFEQCHTFHAARKSLSKQFLHFLFSHPIPEFPLNAFLRCWNGIAFSFGADESLRFNTRHVPRIGSNKVTARKNSNKFD